MQTDIDKRLHDVSEDLNLIYESQDWGIINATPYRVEEFIEYFNRKASRDEQIKYQIFELIIASFNDALLEGLCNEPFKEKFLEFLSLNSKNTTLKPIMDYWISIESEEYPVGKFLKFS